MMDVPILGYSDIVVPPSKLEDQYYSNETGFPFDDSDPEEFQHTQNTSSFRDHLSDIAARHPEFAEHLRPWTTEFPQFRSDTRQRKRHPSGSCGEDDTRSQKSGFSSSSNESQPEPERLTPKKEQFPQRPLPQYGLRNTVDLGQKQSSVDEEDRGQRSMSAPPDQRSNQPQRFVSRVNIEPKMGSTLPKQGAPKESQKPNVRHIPIFVEGRDEPILPKEPMEETETDNAKQHYSFPTFGRAPQQNYQQASQQKPAPPPQASQQKPAPPPQASQQKPAQPPPQPQVNTNDPIFKIQEIQKDVNQLMTAVDQYVGTTKDKQYLYLDEMLTRNLLKLDNIETEGKDTIRQARKEAIRCIEKCISILESKINKPQASAIIEEQPEKPAESTTNIASSEAPVQNMEVEDTGKPTTLEVGGVARAGKESEEVQVENIPEPEQLTSESKRMEVDEISKTDTSQSNTEQKSI